MASIAQLRAEAEQRFIDYPIDLDDGTTVRLRNLLRLDDKGRTTAQTLLGAINDTGGADSDDMSRIGLQERAIRDFLLLVADKPDTLRAEVETWDLPLLLLVIEQYTETTQLPEAPSSAS